MYKCEGEKHQEKCTHSSFANKALMFPLKLFRLHKTNKQKKVKHFPFISTESNSKCKTNDHIFLSTKSCIIDLDLERIQFAGSEHTQYVGLCLKLFSQALAFYAIHSFVKVCCNDPKPKSV